MGEILLDEREIFLTHKDVDAPRYSGRVEFIHRTFKNAEQQPMHNPFPLLHDHVELAKSVSFFFKFEKFCNKNQIN